MLEDLNLEEVLFIDIETVSQVKEFNELQNEWQKHWENKMKFHLSENESAEDLYERAGIYAE